MIIYNTRFLIKVVLKVRSIYMYIGNYFFLLKSSNLSKYQFLTFEVNMLNILFYIKTTTKYGIDIS